MSGTSDFGKAVNKNITGSGLIGKMKQSANFFDQTKSTGSGNNFWDFVGKGQSSGTTGIGGGNPDASTAITGSGEGGTAAATDAAATGAAEGAAGAIGTGAAEGTAALGAVIPEVAAVLV